MDHNHHHHHHNHPDPNHHHHIRHQQQQQHHHNNHLHHHQQPPHHHHHHHQQQQQPMYPPHMIPMPNYTSTNRFPFTSSSPPPPPHTVPPPPSKNIQPLEPIYSGGGSGGYDIDPNSQQKKKRGRPRKYSPDDGGGIALGLSPTTLSSGGVAGDGGGGGGGGGADSSGATPSSENSSRKNRGRPPSSSRKQLDALGNCGVGFTPHVIFVNAGEDIASKIVEFSKQGERTICVLSANGSISNVDLRQPAMSGGVVKYEGQFEIISLSGSFLFSQSSGGYVRTGGLNVSLADSDGRVLGGGVVGVLRAATHVQIIVGSFIADAKKPKCMPSIPLSHMLSYSGQGQPGTDTSPQSQEVSTEGSDENGSNHIDRNAGSYGNSNHPMHHHHNMQMYSQMNWPNPGSKMLQN